MVAWCVETLVAAPAVDRVLVVAPAAHLEAIRLAIGREGHDAAVVPGGASRAASVREGLALVPRGTERVLVHDAARPLLAPALIDAVLAALDDADGAIAAAPVADTVKRASADLTVAATLDRSDLWTAQTPQAFGWRALVSAIERAQDEGRLDAATDCASLVEAAGGRVRLVASAGPNLKVTTPADLDLAERLLAPRAPAV